MKTFTITLTGTELENLEKLMHTRVYKGFTDQQIIENVLAMGLYEESKLYSVFMEDKNEETV